MQWCYSSILKIVYKDKTSKLEILHRIRERTTFCTVIAKRKMAFARNVLKGFGGYTLLTLLESKMGG